MMHSAMSVRTSKDKLASLFLLGNSVCLSSSKQDLSSSEDCAVSLDKFIGHNVKDTLGGRGSISFYTSHTLSDIALFNHDTWLTSNIFKSLVPALPPFPFLEEENTDKVQKIAVKHIF